MHAADGRTGGRWRLLAPSTVAAALLLGACGGSDGNGSAPATEPGSTTGSTTGGSTPGTAPGSATAGLPAGAIEGAERLLDEWVAAGNAPGAMVQVTTPDGTWSDTFGVADTGAGTPMSLDLQHRIGSVSKTFTTTVILMLADEGKLHLEDPVSMYVDGVPNGDQITIEMLGTMTSGLPEYLGNDEFRSQFFADPGRDWEPEELMAASG